MHTYDSHFRALSFVAELDERRELMRRGAGSLKIESQYPYYAIRMQGIAERLPNLHVGDFIKVKRIQAAAGDQNFEGRVQRIDLNKVVIHFSDKFRASRHNNDKFDVQFSFNSMPYRRQHRALEFVAESVRLLFPQPGPEARAWRSPVNLLPISPNILDNVEQMQAVKAIVQAPPGSAPFIIFGPPGTGKTSTVVEAIHQLLAKSADVRVLACTPTNTAADVLAIKLATGPAKLEPDVLFRLNAIWRGRGQDLDNVPDTYPNELLDPYSEINENNVFAIPTKEKLGSFRVVVATCASAGVAESLGLPRGHFTHIIIDEAAQCVEPVTNGAILPLADEGTNVVLAGDPKQLGASCHSKLARAFGLKVSYMERLMKRTIYDLRHAEGIRIMKLKKNFRNHPSIIHFSNQVFYEGELQPMGNADVRMLEQAPSVRNKFPVIFHAIVGEEKHEVGSPSYYNESEALVVKRYVDELRDGYTAGGQLIKLDSEDIGIITPYLDQQHVMKDLCGRKGLKIGTVESFQGQERRVIIVSTVRSRNLGFVSEPQRINVALTRARALVIVVGNPLALAEDPYWRTLLLYINQRGGWRGNPRAADIPALTDSVVRAHDEAMMSGSKTAEAKADAADLLKRLRSVIDTIPPPL
ncbi:P-loop containing nucleoside triphosphate hydrolase protein [Coniophora puteana RWD-64-598 SS2]|uniref:RNA helicase n=1 Tax=Coniophora puteana (strain RWD-64-598) TaxID=741705 RepID=R7SDU8_CONPW|nr:P-loop containing nucleoside triphosphate hydrolase protein [Coniophora puteana RWD-64-598 SS2]EIW74341.1 P-loop containing nucleoside triphosphate hydrolase protein [Coniophora puteana RWD-64-598 SS2]